MRRSRALRVVGHGIRLALFVLFVLWAARFFVEMLDQRGWSPGALFALLVVTGAVSLAWRAALDLRKAVRRLRS